MCIYIYIYRYIHTHKYIYIYIYIFMYSYIYIYIYNTVHPAACCYWLLIAWLPAACLRLLAA